MFKISRTNKIALHIFFGFLFFYLFSAPARLPDGDEAIMVGVGDRIVNFGFGEITSEGQERTKVFSSYGFYLSGYSKFGLGQSLLDIPIVGAYEKAKNYLQTQSFSYYILVVYIVSISLAAGLNSLFFLCCEALGCKTTLAVCLSIILGSTTSIWPYSQTLFADPALGFFWVLAFWSLLSFKSKFRKGWLVVAGLSTGFSVVLKTVALIPVFGFSVYFLFLIKQTVFNCNYTFGKLKRTYVIQSFFCFFLPIILLIGLILFYNSVRFNSWFSFGYSSNSIDIRDIKYGFNVPVWLGLNGLLLSPGKGFFFYNSSALIGLLGWKVFYRKHQMEALLIGSIIISMIFIYSRWWAWHGDWAWGPRFLSGLAPFFLMAGGLWVQENLGRLQAWNFRSALISICGVSLLVISFITQTLGVSFKSEQFIKTALKSFGGRYYHFSEWPIRDDLFIIHFVPEFSPLNGHLWMMKSKLYEKTSSFFEIYGNPPWALLNPVWKPNKVLESPFNFNVWWLNSWDKRYPGYGKNLFVAFLFMVVSLACFAGSIFYAYRIKSET
tara:strand:+ start:99 stop:1751 length:1653 start_codon:yes stop_codon:yes gene_type:complete